MSPEEKSNRKLLDREHWIARGAHCNEAKKLKGGWIL
jgi:hypothetical protein